MNRYLLFSYLCYYPSGGMEDCIFVAGSIEEMEEYLKKYIKEQGYPDDFVEYYDCLNNKIYSADRELLKQGIIKWELCVEEE